MGIISIAEIEDEELFLDYRLPPKAQPSWYKQIDDSTLRRWNLPVEADKPASTHEVTLRMEQVRIRYGSRTILENLDWEIRNGEKWALFGPNGAGKSTTLKMITGILKPTSGSIEFDGHPWQRGDLTKIGALIETPPLYENLTAYENLKVRTTMLGLPDKRIDEVLHIVRLTDTGKKNEPENIFPSCLHPSA